MILLYILIGLFVVFVCVELYARYQYIKPMKYNLKVKAYTNDMLGCNIRLSCVVSPTLLPPRFKAFQYLYKKKKEYYPQIKNKIEGYIRSYVAEFSYIQISPLRREIEQKIKNTLNNDFQGSFKVDYISLYHVEVEYIYELPH